jgi:serine/threonine-protein kinase RsbW
MGKRKTEIGPNPTIPPIAEDNGAENCAVMRIPARPEWVRVVRLATAGVAARLGFSYDEVEDLKLAVAEACNNAILHGNGGRIAAPQSGGAPLVTVIWTILPDRLRISVSDQGRLPAPGLALPEPSTQDAGEEELREGGMGLLLIQTLMDEVELDSGPHADTTLHMIKYAPRVPAAHRVAAQAASTPTSSRSGATNDGRVARRHAQRASSPTGARR